VFSQLKVVHCIQVATIIARALTLRRADQRRESPVIPVINY
jgi:hypothetical protein